MRGFMENVLSTDSHTACINPSKHCKGDTTIKTGDISGSSETLESGMGSSKRQATGTGMHGRSACRVLYCPVAMIVLVGSL